MDNHLDSVVRATTIATRPAGVNAFTPSEENAGTRGVPLLLALALEVLRRNVIEEFAEPPDLFFLAIVTDLNAVRGNRAAPYAARNPTEIQ